MCSFSCSATGFKSLAQRCEQRGHRLASGFAVTGTLARLLMVVNSPVKSQERPGAHQPALLALDQAHPLPADVPTPSWRSRNSKKSEPEPLRRQKTSASTAFRVNPK